MARDWDAEVEQVAWEALDALAGHLSEDNLNTSITIVIEMAQPSGTVIARQRLSALATRVEGEWVLEPLFDRAVLIHLSDRAVLTWGES